MSHKHCLEFWRWSADHAGDLGTRRSRSGMAVMWRSHSINHVRAVQSTIALHNGEYEYNGVKCAIHMRCNSSAARSTSAGQGLGKTRDADVRFLWQQQAVQDGGLKVLSVPTVRICQTRSRNPCPKLMRIVVIGAYFHTGSVGNRRHRKLDRHMIPRIQSPSRI